MSLRGAPVATERRGYSRGLILGLTMAETMLLLVFCLLLAVGAILAKERDKVLKAEQSAAEVQKELQNLKESSARLISQFKGLKPTSVEPLTDDQWRELVVAKDAVDAMKQSGITPDEARQLAPAAEKLRKFDLNIEDLEALAPSIEVLRRNAAVDPEKLEAMFREADGNSKPHAWPPIINLSEADEYTFKTGSAELTPSFEERLRSLGPQIADIAARYDVDVIEVIGHTDERAMSGASNIDKDLKSVLDGKKPIGSLHPADNAGLGLARALAVARVLKAVPELTEFSVLPMSGAQLILPDDRMTNGAQSGDVKERRRIEIRVRKRNQQTLAGTSSN
jgi:flagellar motor protein MotB